MAIIGGGVIGWLVSVELRGAARRSRFSSGSHRARVLVRQRRWLTPSQAVPLANPSMLLKSFRWMLDPDSPLYIQPRSIRIDPLVDRFPAGVPPVEVRARDGGARGTVRVSVDLVGGGPRAVCGDVRFERTPARRVRDAASLESAKKPAIALFVPVRRAAEPGPPTIRAREPAVIGRHVGGYF